MSTHIVDKIEAVRLSQEATGHYEDIFLVMELGGDNNVRDMRGRRARDWGMTCIGPEWQVIGDCCRFAAGCSGGMTKLRGRQTKPEAYIRAYRKALANAADGLQGAASRNIHITAQDSLCPQRQERRLSPGGSGQGRQDAPRSHALRRNDGRGGLRPAQPGRYVTVAALPAR